MCLYNSLPLIRPDHTFSNFFSTAGAEHSLFKTKSIVMRLHYRHYADEGFFHTFKAPGTRLFNNLVIPVRTPDEAKGIDKLTI